MTPPRTQKNRARSSSLFLMELILAILFFSVASAVCVQFFVKSHLLNLDSNALTHAVNECSGVAEVITTTDSLTDGLSLLQAQYPEGRYPDLNVLDDLIKSLVPSDVLVEKNGTIQIYYDEAFAPCAEPSAAYTLDIQITYSGQMMDLVLGMYENSSEGISDTTSGQNADEPIYQLVAKHHIPRRTGAYER